MTCPYHCYQLDYNRYIKVKGDGDQYLYIKENLDTFDNNLYRNYYYSAYGALKVGSDVLIDGEMYVVESINTSTKRQLLKRKPQIHLH